MLQSSKTTVYLPPYLHQYLLARFGTGNNNTLQIRKDSILGSLMEALCDKIGYNHYLPKSKDIPPKYCPLELILPSRMKTFYLPDAKKTIFEQSVYYLFEFSLFETIEFAIRCGMSDYTAANFFAEKYGITENAMSLDNIRKRWRDRQTYMKRKLEQNPRKK